MGPAAYLDVDAVVTAATSAGCDMLHPGYGFGSERPQLAARCAEAGVRFAGPRPARSRCSATRGRRVSDAVSPGTRRVYGSYWNRVIRAPPATAGATRPWWEH